MKNITAKFCLLALALLVPTSGALGATPPDHRATCEQVGDLALKVMYERQSAEQLDSPESSMGWEDKILTAGISLRASQVLISSDADEKLKSIVKFGESIYSECRTGKLGLLQQYVGNQPAPTIQNGNAQMFDIMELLQQELQSLRGHVEELAFNVKRIKEDQNIRYLDLDRRIVALMDQPVIEQGGQAAPSLENDLLGRVSMLEREYESINAFRQATNGTLNNIRTQINALAYGD